MRRDAGQGARLLPWGNRELLHLAPWGELGTRRLQQHLPFLRGVHEGHHHLMFPVEETESEEVLSSFPEVRGVGGEAG